MSVTTNRRRFLQAALAAAAVPAVALGSDNNPPRLKKAVKYGMIGIKAPIREKFELIKSLGFQGVEMDSPSGVDKDEAVKAVKAARGKPWEPCQALPGEIMPGRGPQPEPGEVRLLKGAV